MKTDPRFTLAVLAPLLASACFEIQDLKSVDYTDAASDAGEPLAHDAGDATAHDASDLSDADLDDASDADLSDADLSDASDADLDDSGDGYGYDAGPSCTPASCAPGQVCTPGGTCIDRCDQAGVCLIAATTRTVTSLMADGPVLYVALGATTDQNGNLAPNAELRTQIGDGELTLLTMLPDNAERLESHGEHVYWTATRPDTAASKKLRRIPKSAGSGPVALYADAPISGNVILSDTQVAFRRADGIYVGSPDGATAPRKVRDCPAVGQNEQDYCYPMALHGNTLFYQRPGVPNSYDSNPSVLSSVDLVTTAQLDYGTTYHDTKFLGVDPPYLYVASRGGTQQMIYRRDQRDLAAPDFTIWLGLSPYYAYADPRATQLRGDWVYLLGTESIFGNGEYRKRLVFERMPKTGPVNVQSILPDTFGDTRTDLYVDYALTDTHAFLAVLQTSSTGTLGSLIYRIPLPH